MSTSLTASSDPAAAPTALATSSDAALAPTALTKKPRRRRWRRLVALLGLGGLWTLIHSTGYFSALGGTPEGERLARMERSPQFREGRFANPGVLTQTSPLATPEGKDSVFWRWLFGDEQRRPEHALPLIARTADSFAAPAPAGLSATWLGHSTLIIEIDGRRFLTDPVFSERSSPSSLVGPKRFHPVPIDIADLPPLDGIVISHDHYDHLDEHSVRALDRRGERFYVPLGVGAHLEAWGVPAERITELDWWGEVEIGDVKLVSTPSQHFSGRGLTDRNVTLWTSWALIGPQHRAFFSGDTGLHPALSEIGERLGPFDLTMLEVGAFDEAWSDIHLGAKNALKAHQMLRGETLLPIHWGTFQLALHAWTDPAETLLEHARGQAELALPRPGETVSVGAPAPRAPWWRPGA
ncbi:MAG: MBL fold metallo-hydrolase [Haliangiales bacterium]